MKKAILLVILCAVAFMVAVYLHGLIYPVAVVTIKKDGTHETEFRRSFDVEEMRTTPKRGR